MWEGEESALQNRFVSGLRQAYSPEKRISVFIIRSATDNVRVQMTRVVVGTIHLETEVRGYFEMIRGDFATS